MPRAPPPESARPIFGRVGFAASGLGAETATAARGDTTGACAHAGTVVEVVQNNANSARNVTAFCSNDCLNAGFRSIRFILDFTKNYALIATWWSLSLKS